MFLKRHIKDIKIREELQKQLQWLWPEMSKDRSFESDVINVSMKRAGLRNWPRDSLHCEISRCNSWFIWHNVTSPLSTPVVIFFLIWFYLISTIMGYLVHCEGWERQVLVDQEAIWNLPYLLCDKLLTGPSVWVLKQRTIESEFPQ